MKRTSLKDHNKKITKRISHERKKSTKNEKVDDQIRFKTEKLPTKKSEEMVLLPNLKTNTKMR